MLLFSLYTDYPNHRHQSNIGLPQCYCVDGFGCSIIILSWVYHSKLKSSYSNYMYSSDAAYGNPQQRVFSQMLTHPKTNLFLNLLFLLEGLLQLRLQVVHLSQVLSQLKHNTEDRWQQSANEVSRHQIFWCFLFQKTEQSSSDHC